MCSLCNNTNAMLIPFSSSVFFMPCPDCGPRIKEQVAAAEEELRQMIADAERRFGVGAAGA
ncbi:hypothetical protein BEP19_14980 [Ammoniphilus oxalaticus]|uniref:Uncharacterized protein n=1 Tax=Ammoniphilus oxalaticus TaxID=66863 RepID=A0A419SD17_9BACL|nr:hypothetical protein BEP19_14980 [Ammoniphilus oxalaticus]